MGGDTIFNFLVKVQEKEKKGERVWTWKQLWENSPLSDQLKQRGSPGPRKKREPKKKNQTLWPTHWTEKAQKRSQYNKPIGGNVWWGHKVQKPGGEFPPKPDGLVFVPPEETTPAPV